MLKIEAKAFYRRGRAKNDTPLAGYVATLVGDGADGDAEGVVEHDNMIFGNASAALDCLQRGLSLWADQIDPESLRDELTEAAAVSAQALVASRVDNIMRAATISGEAAEAK